MRKVCQVALFLSLLFLSAVPAFGQNKAGINIGANHGDLQKAAKIVGPGGWVVMMACPGDGDKIAKFVQDNPSVNLVIRGHFAGNNPDKKLAQAWADTLGSIPTPSKIYFMPWNEPNQEGSGDYTTPENLVSYIKNDLLPAFAPIKDKIILLSPMINISHPNYESYTDSILKLEPGFFTWFDGISMNLYDSSDGQSTNGHINPQYADQLLQKLRVSGKQIFGVEAGTSGSNFYWMSKPDSNSPLYRFVQRFDKIPARMLAIPSYDLGGEAGHTWSLFEPDDVINLLKNSTKGNSSPYSGGTFTPKNATLCPNKKYSFYRENQTECSECGGNTSLLSCKPQSATDFGEEYSPEQLKLTETIHNQGSNACYLVNFTTSATSGDMSIPLAYELNQYFLGPYMDNLGARVAKQNPDPVRDFGVFEKLAPKSLQDRLKTEFLDWVISGNSRYQNFSIQGMPASLIKSTHERLSKNPLTQEALDFEKNIWAQVPLFANEESQGEIVFEGAGITGSLKTSVPEVYRLNKVTSWLAQMLGVPQDKTKGAKTEQPAVLPAATSCSLESNPAAPPSKETKTGVEANICTSDTLQINPNANLEGQRHYDESIFDFIDHGGCDQKQPGDCCGISGRCVGDTDETGICQNGSCLCQDGAEDCKIRESEKKIETTFNIKNRVPFLNKIAENTIGPGGFFRLFTPAINDKPEVIENQFKDVAGESKATINLDQVKVITPPVDVDIPNKNNPITLLFYRLGTEINVKNLISGVILWPYRALNEFVGSTGGNTLDYSIDFRNPNIKVTNKEEVMKMVENSWPQTKIRSNWDLVYNAAVSHGWNPAFVIALWIEESGASGVTFRNDLNREVWDLGCTAGQPNNLTSQLDCLFNKAINRDSSFENFMCSYSEGKTAPCTFNANPNFPKNLKIWYDRLIQ